MQPPVTLMVAKPKRLAAQPQNNPGKRVEGDRRPRGTAGLSSDTQRVSLREPRGVSEDATTARNRNKRGANTDTYGLKECSLDRETNKQQRSAESRLPSQRRTEDSPERRGKRRRVPPQAHHSEAPMLRDMNKEDRKDTEHKRRDTPQDAPRRSKLQRVGAKAEAPRRRSRPKVHSMDDQHEQRKLDKHTLCLAIQRRVDTAYEKIGRNPGRAILSLAAYRTAKLEALPGAVRTIEQACRLSHVAAYCKFENGLASSVEIKIGFANDRDVARLKKIVDREVRMDFDARWKY